MRLLQQKQISFKTKRLFRHFVTPSKLKLMRAPQFAGTDVFLSVTTLPPHFSIFMHFPVLPLHLPPLLLAFRNGSMDKNVPHIFRACVKL